MNKTLPHFVRPLGAAHFNFIKDMMPPTGVLTFHEKTVTVQYSEEPRTRKSDTIPVDLVLRFKRPTGCFVLRYVMGSERFSMTYELFRDPELHTLTEIFCEHHMLTEEEREDACLLLEVAHYHRAFVGRPGWYAECVRGPVTTLMLRGHDMSARYTLGDTATLLLQLRNSMCDAIVAHMERLGVHELELDRTGSVKILRSPTNNRLTLKARPGWTGPHDFTTLPLEKIQELITTLNIQ